MNTQTHKWIAGDTVKLKKGTTVGTIPEGRENHRTAKIKAILTDITGGYLLDRDLGGMKYWNETDLDFVSPSQEK